jgi:Zn-dependent protease
MGGQVGAFGALHPDLVLYFAVSTLVALVGHEFAHAFAATRLGDPTPKMMGRLTLNPRPHLDTFGSIVFPAILLLIVLFSGSSFMFAYARPMPLNPWSTRRATRDTVLVQAAGPVANLLLAFAFAALYQTVCGVGALQTFLAAGVLTNATFAAIHILPIPPLDGARAITPFLSGRAREVFMGMEQYAPLFILLLFFILGGFFQSLVLSIRNGLLGLFPFGGC